MKAFRFKLEQLLRLKIWNEEAAKKALAVEVATLETMQARLAELQDELAGVLAAGGEGPGNVFQESFDFQGRLGILQYARHLGEKMAEQEGEISLQGRRLKEKSDLLVKALQERKALEKLKERRKEEFKVARNRLAATNLDEASAGFLNRARQASASEAALDGQEDGNAPLEREIDEREMLQSDRIENTG